MEEVEGEEEAEDETSNGKPAKVNKGKGKPVAEVEEPAPSVEESAPTVEESAPSVEESAPTVEEPTLEESEA